MPFRVGEEVHVQIIEPHMYSPGDAVAKVDGYVISIVGGGPYVGQKQLVRIDEAGRTAAVASLVDAEPGTSGGGVAAGSSSTRTASRSRSRKSSPDGKVSSGAATTASGAAKTSSGSAKASSGAAKTSSGSRRSGQAKPKGETANGDTASGQETPTKSDSEDGLQSKPRRRGRRGGRRRSGAKAKSAESAASSS
jgi:ribonuclease G